MLSKEICKRCIQIDEPKGDGWGELPWWDDEEGWKNGKVLCVLNMEIDKPKNGYKRVNIYKPPPLKCRYFLEQMLYHEQTKDDAKQRNL